jgi:hypothetical protein
MYTVYEQRHSFYLFYLEPTFLDNNFPVQILERLTTLSTLYTNITLCLKEIITKTFLAISGH